MEHIEESVIASVLTDALSRYMRYLEVEQELHERSQPRQGKGAETSIDLTRAEYFRARTVATESCLLVADRIAENVRRWAVGDDEAKGVGCGKEKQVKSSERDQGLIDLKGEIPSLPGYGFQIAWDDEDDEPYINPITGQWITPVTSKSAGPSNTPGLYEEYLRKPIFDCSLEADTFLSPLTIEMKKSTTPEILVDLERSTNIGVQPEGGVSLLPQHSTTPHLLDLDNSNPPQYEALIRAILPGSIPNRRSPSSSPGSNTPNSSFRNTDLEPEDAFFDCEEERQRIANLQHEWASDENGLENTLQFAFSSENATIPSHFDFDSLPTQKLQSQLDNDAQQSSSLRDHDSYAQKLEQEKRIRVLDLDAELRAARRLASEWETQDAINEQSIKCLQEKWATEDKMLEEQIAFADAIRRSDEAREQAILRDQTAAMAAQNQWEQEVREAEDSARRLIIEEIEREDEEERERIRAAAEAAERLAEELERQEEEERQRLAAEAAEAERRARQADCVVCMEPSDKADMCLLSCEHYYCGECIVAAFNTALTSRATFTCCSRNIPPSIATRFLPAQTVTEYDLMILELTTPNPRYCSNRHCRLFIPPNSVHGPVAICPSCNTRTCSSCNSAEHAGVCAEDQEGAAVVALANSKGWKTCPRCRTILERTEGCLHMTCRCGAEWCYSCLGDWRNCRSTCSRA